MAKIIFTNTFGVPEEFYPQPTYKMLPEWYKQTESYVDGKKKPKGNGDTSGTIKRCMPVFDALTSGYYLITYTDLYVSQEENINTFTAEFTGTRSPRFQWSSLNPIQFHPLEQAPLHPVATGDQIPKWINPWSIKTPPGYSTLFIPPVHRENAFVALPGVVDTDTYTAPVNIVFTLSNPDFEGLIPAGTPIAQVIPFKRESWEMKIGEEKEIIDQNKVTTLLRTKFFDSYKTQFRHNKEYR
jgi:hypothetical protein